MSEADWVGINEITPWDKNPRKNDKAVDAIAKSITRFGWGNPIIVRKADGVIVAGHTRWKAAKKLGMDKVLVRYMDLDPAQAKALALADNKLGELADWDDDALAEILAELKTEGADVLELGWQETELARLFKDAGINEPDGSADDVPEVVEGVADSQVGTVYELGPHRLLCGDSTAPHEETWGRLLLDGEKLDMVWTDPPYGVDMSGVNEALAKSGKASKTRESHGFKNDALSPDGLRKFLGLALGSAFEGCRPGASWYVASPPGDLFFEFAHVLGREGLGLWKHTLAWVKNCLVIGRADYHYRHEAVFYGWVPGGAHYFTPDRKNDSVLEYDKPQRNGEHPTMKPVELVTHCIVNSSKPGWLVGEPFGGSGTTLIAAAETGRIARVIELDPKYCDVIRRRWTKYARERNLEVGSGGLK